MLHEEGKDWHKEIFFFTLCGFYSENCKYYIELFRISYILFSVFVYRLWFFYGKVDF